MTDQEINTTIAEWRGWTRLETVGNALYGVMPGDTVTIRTNTWITVGPGVERLTNGNVILTVHLDRITKIARVPVLYSNGVRVGPLKP